MAVSVCQFWFLLRGRVIGWIGKCMCWINQTWVMEDIWEIMFLRMLFYMNVDTIIWSWLFAPLFSIAKFFIPETIAKAWSAQLIWYFRLPCESLGEIILSQLYWTRSVKAGIEYMICRLQNRCHLLCNAHQSWKITSSHASSYLKRQTQFNYSYWIKLLNLGFVEVWS